MYSANGILVFYSPLLGGYESLVVARRRTKRATHMAVLYIICNYVMYILPLELLVSYPVVWLDMVLYCLSVT